MTLKVVMSREELQDAAQSIASALFDIYLYHFSVLSKTYAMPIDTVTALAHVTCSALEEKVYNIVYKQERKERK